MYDYPDREILALSVARAVTGALRTALGDDRRATLVTAADPELLGVFEALRGADLDWARVLVLSADGGRESELAARLLADRAAAARLVPLGSDQLAESLPPAVVLLGVDVLGAVGGYHPADDPGPLAGAGAGDADAPCLTLPVLAAAPVIHLVFTGEETHGLVEGAGRQSSDVTTALSVLGPDATMHWAP